MELTVQVKKLHDCAILPTCASYQAAGYDLYALPEGDGSVTIPPQHTVKIGTGLAFAIPQGYFGAVFARSGLASREGLRPANCVGVIDSDYRGECIVALYNDSTVEKTVNRGDRIAQLVLLPCVTVDFVQTDTLTQTERGTGGFGSTGK